MWLAGCIYREVLAICWVVDHQCFLLFIFPLFLQQWQIGWSSIRDGNGYPYSKSDG